MSYPPQQTWPGWTMIAPGTNPSFTLWLTGLHGVGKSTLAELIKKALTGRGYKVEIIDSKTLTYWLQRELHIKEEQQEDQSHTPGYDAFITYLCTILAHNGIITITTSVSPLRAARNFAREHIQNFIEIYLHCPHEQRIRRLRRRENLNKIGEHLYQRPQNAELSLDTSQEAPEYSALHIINYLEQQGYIAPLWEESTSKDEATDIVHARLLALGYLE